MWIPDYRERGGSHGSEACLTKDDRSCPDVKEEDYKEMPYDYLTYGRDKGRGINEERSGLYFPC